MRAERERRERERERQRGREGRERGPALFFLFFPAMMPPWDDRDRDINCYLKFHS